MLIYLTCDLGVDELGEYGYISCIIRYKCIRDCSKAYEGTLENLSSFAIPRSVLVLNWVVRADGEGVCPERG